MKMLPSKRIGPPAAELIGDGGEQPIVRAHGHAAGVQERKAARAVGRLDHARLDAGLAHGGRLLVARHAQHRHRRTENVGGGDAELARAIDDLGQERRRHAEQLQEAFVPGAFVDVEQQAAAGIGGVARMHLAAGQAPQQEAFDGAGRQRPLLRRGPAAGDMVEDPGDLGAGEIGIEDQAGLRRDLALMAGALQRLAAVGRAAVLPDDGVVDRLAGAAVPHHRGLALVGDADAGQRLGVELGLGERAAADLDRRPPDLLGVVLDPAGFRKDLRQLFLRAGHRPAGGVEHDGTSAGGALVDGEDVLGGHPAFLAGFEAPAQCARAMAKSTASSRAALSGLSGKSPSASRAMAP